MKLNVNTRCLLLPIFSKNRNSKFIIKHNFLFIILFSAFNITINIKRIEIEILIKKSGSFQYLIDILVR